MLKNSQLILIAPRGKRYSCRPPKLLTGIVAVLALSSALCYFASAVLLAAKSSAAAFTLFEEYRGNRLARKIADIQSFASHLESTFDSLFFEDDFRRAALGARTVHNEIREVGIGGPASPSDIEAGFGLPSDKAVLDLKNRLAKLVRQSDFQLFSQNDFCGFFRKQDAVMRSIPAITPAPGKEVSGFGLRIHPILHYERMHNGVDIVNNVGTAVCAAADGTAQWGVSETFGTYVLITHPNGFSTIYAHLASAVVKDNEAVGRGHVIGYLGNTGLSLGPHLHYEVHVLKTPVDPEPYLLPDDFIVD